ncbi:ribosomal protein S5 domain 2-type protein [Spinellus fusiger]|nr:ribosomal protein S5 domain 2-type protein [Spinellus fusiger]
MTTNTTTTTKNFEIFSRIQPYEYLRRFLGQDIRPDGRTLDQFRSTLITAGTITTANASAMVRLGGTTVVCGIKAEVCEPSVDNPNEGYLVPNVELSPMCSPKFRPGPPPARAQAVSEFIHQIITKSQIVPLEALCIEPGKAVWVLYCDIVCLNYNGNIMDTSLLALITALKTLTLPKAQVSPTMTVEADPSEKICPFELTHFPVASTFCVFNQPTVLLSDPDDTEETLAKETVTIVMNTQGEIHRVYKNGGTQVGTDILRACFAQSRRRTEQVKQLIEEAICQ